MMKKILLLLVFLGLNMSVAFAEDYLQRVRNLDPLEQKAFEWDPIERYEEYFEEVVPVAKKVYEQNPGSFNAAYNYGLLQYDLYMNEIPGPAVSKKELIKAFHAFEHAAALPNITEDQKNMALEREYHVLYSLLIGYSESMDFNETLLEKFEENLEYAEKFRAVIEALFESKGIQITQVQTEISDEPRNALYGFLISLALEQDEEALKWLPAVGGEQGLKEYYLQQREVTTELELNEQSPEWWRSVQKNYANALRRIGIDVIPWRKEFLRNRQALNEQTIQREAQERFEQQKRARRLAGKWLFKFFMREK